jgi:hypothetical protein
MSNEESQSRPAWSPELALVVLIPVLTLLAGAAMIHVASSFGFTALGEPVAMTASAATPNSR